MVKAHTSTGRSILNPFSIITLSLIAAGQGGHQHGPRDGQSDSGNHRGNAAGGGGPAAHAVGDGRRGGAGETRLLLVNIDIQ